MASGGVRTALSRSWPSPVTGILTSVGGSLLSTVGRYRSYSDEGLDHFVASSPAAEADPPADSPPSSGFPPVVPMPTTHAVGTEYGKNTYPPRNYRTPRGVYKAIVLGEVGQLPIQKILKSGKSVTIFSVGTGGMYNNRRPFEGESAEEFAERSYTQWHRVSVYQQRVASLVMQHVKIGSQVYLEGNIESRVYNDPNTGIVKRIREIAIRANGRLMFMHTPGMTGPAEDMPVPAPSTDAQSGSSGKVRSLP